MISRQLVFGVFLLAASSALAIAAKQDGATSSAPGANKQPAKARNEGERVFQQHCSRCHSAPEGFSPRISGTIVRHMRVRASLSQHEEDELLHFFNP